MISNPTSTLPTLNPDGTLSAIVREIQSAPPAGHILRLWLPLDITIEGGFGRFFLVRCTEDTLEARRDDWSIYNRRAIYCAGIPNAISGQPGSTWDLLVPNTEDPGHKWLARRQLNTIVNLLGPFGQSFQLTGHTRALLVLANPVTLPLTLPIIHTMLDRGGRVTLLIQGEIDAATPLLSLVPIQVEVRIIDAAAWSEELAEPVRWADQLCAALPNPQYTELAHRLRTLRFQLDKSFAHVFVTSDLLCGVGACLACVVSTRDGSFSRACIHGPVFPLSTLAA